MPIRGQLPCTRPPAWWVLRTPRPVDGVIPAFSEDSGLFQDECPGAMCFLGASDPQRGWVTLPHSPQFVAHEEAIFVGARVMAAVMLDRILAR